MPKKYSRSEPDLPEWLYAFSEEDWQFIKRLILASGSLKAVAAEYGISYPTVRIRMDRIIEKLEIVESQEIKSVFHQKLKLMVAEGEIEYSTAKKILEIHNSSTSQGEEHV